MEEDIARFLDVRFHGICTHFPGMNTTQGTSHRVILLQCNEPGFDPHRPLLSVPPEVTVSITGDPECRCIEEIKIPGDDDLHFRLDGVHLKMIGSAAPLNYDAIWDCGVPKLTALYAALGPIAQAKVSQEPPDHVSAWFDVTNGTLGPYTSLKGAVAVRLLATYRDDQPIRITATCWRCPDTTWTFTLASRSKVRVSNDCGTAGSPEDFLIHYRIAENPPPDPPKLDQLPACLPPSPSWADAPPGDHNASLGCSNSGYP